MTNKNRTVLYIGVTSDLFWRVIEHKNGTGSKFTAKYNAQLLIYFERFQTISHAIEREKQLKRWRRSWKINLVKSINPNLEDLSKKWLDPETSSG